MERTAATPLAAFTARAAERVSDILGAHVGSCDPAEASMRSSATIGTRSRPPILMTGSSPRFAADRRCILVDRNSACPLGERSGFLGHRVPSRAVRLRPRRTPSYPCNHGPSRVICVTNTSDENQNHGAVDIDFEWWRDPKGYHLIAAEQPETRNALAEIWRNPDLFIASIADLGRPQAFP